MPIGQIKPHIYFDPTSEQMDWSRIRHFTPDEFDDPNYPGSHQMMDPLTIIRLDQLRHQTGWKIITHNKFGLRSCVCVDKDGHASSSLHYPPHCSAVDFHFDTGIDPRAQVMKVLRSGFTGIGIYYDWHWDNLALPVGFHVDGRSRPQIWKRLNGKYIYFLE